jgi:hypothetical protein
MMKGWILTSFFAALIATVFLVEEIHASKLFQRLFINNCFLCVSRRNAVFRLHLDCLSLLQVATVTIIQEDV